MRLPAVADETVLDRELGGVGRLALALARPNDDQLERPVLGAELPQLRKAWSRLSRVACRSVLTAEMLAAVSEAGQDVEVGAVLRRVVRDRRAATTCHS